MNLLRLALCAGTIAFALVTLLLHLPHPRPP